MKKYIIILVLTISPILISFGCTTPSQNTSSSSGNTTSTGLQISTVTRGNISQQIAPSGNLVMPQDANLSFGSGGTVKEVPVDIGDTVKKGQVLSKLDTIDLERNLIQAQISVKSAQQTLDTALTPNLNSSGALATSPDAADIEIKTLQLQAAKLNLESAQRNLDKAIIIAPFDGLIATVNTLVGDEISASTVITRIFDPSQVQVYAYVNEMDVYQVKVGQLATVQINALTNIQLQATVFAISPSAVIQGGVVNYPVKMKVNLQPQQTRFGSSGNFTNTSGSPFSTNGTSPAFSANGTPPFFSNNGTLPGSLPSSTNRTGTRPGGAAQASVPTLKEGLTVTISLAIQERNNVILVPSRAVLRQGSISIVQVVKSDGSIENRPVTTGLNNSQQVEIISGLSEGEKVAVQKAATVGGFPQPMMIR